MAGPISNGFRAKFEKNSPEKRISHFSHFILIVNKNFPEDSNPFSMTFFCVLYLAPSIRFFHLAKIRSIRDWHTILAKRFFLIRNNRWSSCIQSSKRRRLSNHHILLTRMDLKKRHFSFPID